jgi:type III secretory pathway component EscU
MVTMVTREETLEEVEHQVDLYQELLELTKKEHKLLKEDGDPTEVQEEKREIRDEIAAIDMKFNIKQSNKLKLIMSSTSEKLQQFKPTLKKLYDLEKKNQNLTR